MLLDMKTRNQSVRGAVVCVTCTRSNRLPRYAVTVLKEIKAWVFFTFLQKSRGGLYFED